MNKHQTALQTARALKAGAGTAHCYANVTNVGLAYFILHPEAKSKYPKGIRAWLYAIHTSCTTEATFATFYGRKFGANV